MFNGESKYRWQVIYRHIMSDCHRRRTGSDDDSGLLTFTQYERDEFKRLQVTFCAKMNVKLSIFR